MIGKGITTIKPLVEQLPRGLERQIFEEMIRLDMRREAEMLKTTRQITEANNISITRISNKVESAAVAAPVRSVFGRIGDVVIADTVPLYFNSATGASITGVADGVNQDIIVQSGGAGKVILRPEVDSTSAIQLQKADGTSFMDFDFIHNRLGVNTQQYPNSTFSVVETNDATVSRGICSTQVCDLYNDLTPLQYNWGAQVTLRKCNGTYLAPSTVFHDNYIGGIVMQPWVTNTSQTSGTFTIGEQYEIEEYNSDDDFTNCGALQNAVHEIFVATLTDAAHWEHASKLSRIHYIITAGIFAAVNGTVTATKAPTDLCFYTSPDGFNLPDPYINNPESIRIRVSADGDVTIGNTNLVQYTSGSSLVIGCVYEISTYWAGDDFSNVATVLSGTINTLYCVFLATGTTPTTWNGSILKRHSQSATTVNGTFRILETGYAPHHYGSLAMPDMSEDWTYTFPNASGYVALNPTTTQGDIIFASNTATPAILAKLAIGGNGTLLQVGALGDGFVPKYTTASYPSSALAGTVLICNTENIITALESAVSPGYLKIEAGVISWATGGMVYPGEGIALSTGTGWDTSIANNSANWNTAYGWGDHAGLYLAIGGTAVNSALLGGYPYTAFSPVAGSASIVTVGTIVAGVWAGTGIDVSRGGTGGGSTTFTAYMPICGGTTQTNPFQSVATGTQYYPLCYNTSGSLPTFQLLPVAGGGTGLSAIAIRSVLACNTTPDTLTAYTAGAGVASVLCCIDDVVDWYVSASVFASTPLNNISSVAINTSLISDTDITDDLGSLAIRWNSIYGAVLSTGDTVDDTLLIQAYDSDGATGATFITLTAGNTPTCNLDTDVTINSAYIYRAGGTDVPVADGGTGAGTFALNGILYGNTTSAIGVTAIGAAGQILTVGADPFVPAWTTLTMPATIAAGSVFVANAANVLVELNSVAGTTVLTNTTGTISWAAAGGGGAPTTATYLTATAEAGLSAEVNLGALASGLLYGTVAAGTSTISAYTTTGTGTVVALATSPTLVTPTIGSPTFTGSQVVQTFSTAANYLVDNTQTDYLIFVTATAAITLPANPAVGRTLIICNTGSGTTVTVARNLTSPNAQTINGAASDFTLNNRLLGRSSIMLVAATTGNSADWQTVLDYFDAEAPIW